MDEGRVTFRAVVDQLRKRGITLKERDAARTFLAHRRRALAHGVSFRFPIVVDDELCGVDFGSPSDWNSGTARAVLSRKCHVEFVEVGRGGQATLTPPPQFGSRSRRPSIVLEAAEEVRSAEDFMKNITCGVWSDQGPRSRMEDTHAIVPDFHLLMKQHCPPQQRRKLGSRNKRSLFVGVYDGHGGVEAADHCRTSLHVNIAKNMWRDSWVEAVENGFSSTESEFLTMGRQTKVASGAVASTLLFHGWHVYVANVGDARAVLCRAGKAVDLTRDHTPMCFEEKRRVEREGGTVEFGMVGGMLAVSRAFGDLDPDLDCNSKLLGVTAVPEVQVHRMVEEDEFIILACDGLWDVFPSQVAVTFARLSLMHYNDVQKTCKDMVQEALRRQSSDNITCCIVGFNRLDPIDGSHCIVLDPARRRPVLRHHPSPSPSPNIGPVTSTIDVPPMTITSQYRPSISSLAKKRLLEAIAAAQTNEPRKTARKSHAKDEEE